MLEASMSISRPIHRGINIWVGANFTHVLNNGAFHGTPNSDATAACPVHSLTWALGGYCDAELVHARGTRAWANRLQLYGPGASSTLPESDM